jgi:MFS transporter, ACS family, tartrate transporter
MDSREPTTATKTELSDVGQRARRRVAYRLLPFVFLLYIVNYIDRVNVSFANLRMSADLGFSDRVYGLGVAMFYVTYILFEIPGALIVERWSARKWIARIMISWGIVTILTGFVHTAGQFYTARFFLGVAESSFFPGMIVYLTHWFRQYERSRAIACFYVANPAASLICSPVAGWLLGVHWRLLAGWRWLFILEGIPAIVLGIVTVFYLTDWPAQARWLPPDERDWLVSELQEELQRIAGGAAGEKESSRPHDPASVLRPANSDIDCCLLLGAQRIARNHLLDTSLREASFGIF